MIERSAIRLNGRFLNRAYRPDGRWTAWNRPGRIANCRSRDGRPSNYVVRANILTSNETPAQFQLQVVMPNEAKPVARPWQRFLRPSVRGLIVLVLVIGAGLGWLVRSARIQREAVEAIKSAKGTVRYDWEWNRGHTMTRGKPWAPRRLIDRLGPDYFGEVTRVEFWWGSTPTEATFLEVARLAQLQSLVVVPTVSDADLQHLEGLTSLSDLYRSNSQVTDAGLMHLKALTKLDKLAIDSPTVTDAGANELKRALPKLRIQREWAYHAARNRL